MAILSLSDYKAALGISDSLKDVQYQWLLDAASTRIKTYCNRDFEQANYTEYHTGGDRPELVLRQYPVTAVANVWERSSGVFGQDAAAPFDSATLLVVGKDYVLSKEGANVGANGLLIRIGKPWPQINFGRDTGRLSVLKLNAWGNIKVEYTAGYTVETMPKDLQQTVLMLTQYWRMVSRFGVPLKEEQLGRWSYELQNVIAGDLPPDVKGILSQYREEVW